MTATTAKQPALPAARGPLSAAVLSALRGERPEVPAVDGALPYGEDLQLAFSCAAAVASHGRNDERRKSSPPQLVDRHPDERRDRGDASTADPDRDLRASTVDAGQQLRQRRARSLRDVVEPGRSDPLSDKPHLRELRVATKRLQHLKRMGEIVVQAALTISASTIVGPLEARINGLISTVS